MTREMQASLPTSTPYVVPARPPAEALAELDEAVRVLDAMQARAATLVLGTDGARNLRIELRDDAGSRPLRPSELLDLLAGG